MVGKSIQQYDLRMQPVVKQHVELAIKFFWDKIKSVLVLGTGPGYDTHLFSEHGFDAIGIDINAEVITYAKKNYSGNFVQADIKNLNRFKSKSFDAVYSSFTLNYFLMNEISEISQQVYRILRPGGRLYLVVNNAEFIEMKRLRHPKRTDTEIIKKYGTPYSEAQLTEIFEPLFDITSSRSDKYSSMICAVKK